MSTLKGAHSQWIILYNVILTAGPQHREFRKEILQAMQVGSGAPIRFPISTSNASLC